MGKTLTFVVSMALFLGLVSAASIANAWSTGSDDNDWGSYFGDNSDDWNSPCDFSQDEEDWGDFDFGSWLADVDWPDIDWQHWDPSPCMERCGGSDTWIFPDQRPQNWWWGSDDEGRQHPWCPAVPEPTAALVFGLGFLMVQRVSRKRHS